MMIIDLVKYRNTRTGKTFWAVPGKKFKVNKKKRRDRVENWIAFRVMVCIMLIPLILKITY